MGQCGTFIRQSQDGATCRQARAEAGRGNRHVSNIDKQYTGLEGVYTLGLLSFSGVAKGAMGAMAPQNLTPMTTSQWIATVGSHKRWPTSSTAVY